MSDYRKYLRNQTLPGMSEMETDMMRQLPLPPMEKPIPEGATTFPLVDPEACARLNPAFFQLLETRVSRRRFPTQSLTQDELSALLWATQGVRGTLRNGLVTDRTVPSGGGMHPFETYLAIRRTEDLQPGLYRYVATRHRLLKVGEEPPEPEKQLGRVCNGQMFVDQAPVVFVWAVRPYRTEYRYGDDSLKDLLISVGHICQNLYMACEAIGLGTCAILAYQQTGLDQYFGLDGNDEIPLYLAPVGHVEAEA